MVVSKHLKKVILTELDYFHSR